MAFTIPIRRAPPTAQQGTHTMTRKHTIRSQPECPCPDDRISQDRRCLLFGGALLGVASATGLFARATDAAAQGAPNPGTTAPPRAGNFILRGGYVITM